MKNKKVPKHVKWVQNTIVKVHPHDAYRQLLETLTSEAECVKMFKALAGLGLLAAMYGDKDGQNACTDSFFVLSNAYHNLENIKMDIYVELATPYPGIPEGPGAR